MNSLEHFVIGDEKSSQSFVDLTTKSENLNKDDFLETGYFVDDSIFERKYGKGSSSTRRGKEKVAPADDEPLHTEPADNLDCDDDGDLRWTQEDIHMTPGSTSVPSRDDIRVSSASPQTVFVPHMIVQGFLTNVSMIVLMRLLWKGSGC